MPIHVALSSVPAGTCARVAAPGSVIDYETIYQLRLYSVAIDHVGYERDVWEAWVGERWHRERGDFYTPPVATDPYQIALVGERHLATYGVDADRIRGSSPAVAEASRLLLEEVAALGGPGADAETMAEWTEMLAAYLRFFRQWEPGQEVIYTQF